MAYNEQEFYRLVKKANFMFNKSKSSLANLIKVMDQRPTLQQLGELRNAIRAIPDAKKLRYQEALRYLELEYAGDWLGVPQPPTPPGLIKQQKSGWVESQLKSETVMVHCTGAPPSSVMLNGIDPQRATEWCVPPEINAPIWKWNRFVFLFPVEDANFPPKGAKQFGFGDAGYIYVVKLPKDTPYMNQGGNIASNKETAFPKVIKPNQILGIFQYMTGDKEKPARRKDDYTLAQLSLQHPHTNLLTYKGSNSNASDLNVPAGTKAKLLLAI
jgi:hypothetical protein